MTHSVPGSTSCTVLNTIAVFRLLFKVCLIGRPWSLCTGQGYFLLWTCALFTLLPQSPEAKRKRTRAGLHVPVALPPLDVCGLQPS